MSTPISRGVMCQRRRRIGRAKARDSALKASKKVALPITMRALVCQGEKGTLSIRAMSSSAPGGGTAGVAEGMALGTFKVRFCMRLVAPRAWVRQPQHTALLE